MEEVVGSLLRTVDWKMFQHLIGHIPISGIDNLHPCTLEPYDIAFVQIILHLLLKGASHNGAARILRCKLSINKLQIVFYSSVIN